MTYAAGPANNLHQWLNKYVPELQTKTIENQALNRASNYSQFTSQSDRVSLSSDAARLDQVIADHFPKSQLSNDDVRQVSLDLYQKGLIGAEDYRRLTGEKLPHQGSITQALDFLTRFVEMEAVDGDSEGAKTLSGALDVLRNVESPMTALRANQEREVTHFVNEYRDLLQEAEADPELIHEFDRVANVFNALADLRGQSHQGVVASYASLNAALRG